MSEKKRPAHRPPEMTEGRKVTVYLDAASIEKARQIGDGNLSSGIRQAVNEHKLKKPNAREGKNE